MKRGGMAADQPSKQMKLDVLAVHEQWENAKGEWLKESQALNRPEPMRSLYYVIRRTGPVWQNTLFEGMVPTLESCALPSLPPDKVVEIFLHLLSRTVEEQSAFLTHISSTARSALARFVGGASLGIPAWRRATTEMGSMPCVTEIARRVAALSPGDVLVLPGFNEKLTRCVVVLQDPEEGEELVHVAVVDTDINNKYHPKAISKGGDLLQHAAVGFDKIPKDHINEGWWLFLSVGRQFPTDEAMYTKVLTPLFEKYGSYAEGVRAWLEGSGKDAVPCVPKAEGTLWGSLTESLRYVLRRGGAKEEEVEKIGVAMYMQLMKWVVNDLHTVKQLTKGERKMIEAACQGFARCVTRFAAGEEGRALATIEYVKRTADGLPGDEGVAPPPLDLDTGKEEGLEDRRVFPHMETLRRPEGVDDFAGPPIPHPRFLAADFLVFGRGRAQSMHDVVGVLHDLDRLCTRVAVQQSVVKNSVHLRFSLLSHVLLEHLPMPVAKAKRLAGERCLWQDTPVTHAEMNYCMQLLWRVCLHWAATVCSLRDTPELKAFKLTVPAVLTCMADALLRNPLSDRPSLLSGVFEGADGSGGYGVGAGGYAVLTETACATYPQLLEARAYVLDYLEQRGVPPQGTLFRWEHGMKRDVGSHRLLQALAYSNAFPVRQAQEYLVGKSDPYYLLIMNAPEFGHYRDICFYFKFFMSTVPNQVAPEDHSQFSAVPEFTYLPCMGYRVKAFGTYLSCKMKKRQKPSHAMASRFTYPNVVENEDDLLHLPTLPSFDVLSQSDAELLLSFLLVPYIRIPLILEFFSTEDRVSALRSKDLRKMMDSVLFEPWRFLEYEMEGKAPQTVPSEDGRLLSTPYGLLLNELQHNPEGVTRPMLRLLKLAQELDAGTVMNAGAVDVILYLVRTIARVDVFIRHLLRRDGGAREVEVPRGELEKAHAAIRSAMECDVEPMLNAWVDEVMQHHMSGVEASAHTSHISVAEATVVASRVHAHLVITQRAGSLGEGFARTLLPSFVFLTTRHTWNAGKLSDLPEVELYDVLQERREDLVLWMTSFEGTDHILREAVRTATSSTKGDSDLEWGLVGGEGSLGRFTIAEEDVASMDPELVASASQGLRKGRHGHVVREGAVIVPEGKQCTEVNVQTMQVTFKTAHLRALDSSVAVDRDVSTLLQYLEAETATVQCADVEQTEHREWVRLVGLDVDVQHWKTPDPRVVIPDQGRDYPEGANAHEGWVVALAEPVRLSFFIRPPWEPPILFTFPERESTAETTTVRLDAIDSRNGEKLAELFVYRDHSCVMVYSVFSYGRRFYRSMVYTTDSRASLEWIQPSEGDRGALWEPWNRHAAGNATSNLGTSQCCVLSRTKFAAGNISGTRETFVPSRLLCGLIPDALLETHVFFQDEHDTLRGYPKKEDTGDDSTRHTSHVLMVTLHNGELRGVDTSTVARVVRYADSTRCPRSATSAEMAVDSASGAQGASVEDSELLLLDPLHAPRGTPLHSLARVLMRIESLSHVLVWTRDLSTNPTAPLSIDLVQLPRLKLTFTARVEDGVTRLYSLDHSNLFVSNRLPKSLQQLIDGLPHSLLLQDTEDQMSILIPAFPVSRPHVHTAPLSTELVLRKCMKWLGSLDVRYHLYQVHVSLSFVFTPTLASRLFLLWMRFLARDYAAVCHLVSTIGTDAEQSWEESQVYLAISGVRDDHPDAVASLLKVYLALKDIPPGCVHKRYFPAEAAQYVRRRAEVSVACRLTESEEVRMLEEAISLEGKVKKLLATTAISEDREEKVLREMTLVSKGCPLSEQSLTLLTNRLKYLKGETGGTVGLACPPIGPDDGKAMFVSTNLLTADLSKVSLQTSLSSSMSGYVVENIVRSLMQSNQPDMFNLAVGPSWLNLYLLLVGQTKCKIGSGATYSPNAGYTIASIARHFVKGSHENAGMSLVHIAAANRAACLGGMFPKFPASLKVGMHQTITADPDSHNRLVLSNATPKLKKTDGVQDNRPPLLVMLEKARSVVKEAPMGSLRLEWSAPSSEQQWLQRESVPVEVERPPSMRTPGVPLNSTSEQPGVTDYSLSRRLTPLLNLRHVEGVEVSVKGFLGHGSAKAAAAEVEHFSQMPLGVLHIEGLVLRMGREQSGMAEVSGELPFDLREHPAAQSFVAEAMLTRLERDMRDFAEQTNTAQVPQLRHMSSSLVQAMKRGEVSQKDVISKLQRAERDVTLARKVDERYVEEALAALECGVKWVPSGVAGDVFRLGREAGWEVAITHDMLFAALLSSQGTKDLQKLNPFLTDVQCGELLDLVAYTALHASRLGQLNAVHREMGALSSMVARGCSADDPAFSQKADVVASLLCQDRCYMRREGNGMAYDPRFLVFEFIWNILLRRRQVEMVEDFMQAHRQGTSHIKQMIMG
eukprot:Sspe_Gene.56011::Locus_30819_Transcript_1_1_Confidence_1.000_Length_7199::g.56011::m.56011